MFVLSLSSSGMPALIGCRETLAWVSTRRYHILVLICTSIKGLRVYVCICVHGCNSGSLGWNRSSVFCGWRLFLFMGYRRFRRPLPFVARRSAVGDRRSAITICICNIPLCLFNCRPSAVGGLRSAIGRMCEIPLCLLTILTYHTRRSAVGDRR